MTTTASVHSTSDSSVPDHCAICFEHLDEDQHRPAAGPCEHLDTCALCYLRLRRLLGDMTCPMCKSVQDSVFIFDGLKAVRPYKILNIWGDNAGPGTVFDDQSRVFMPKAFHRDVFQALQSPACRVPSCGTPKCRNRHALKEHLAKTHEKYLCEVCVDNKKVFLGEQDLYTKGDLARHRDEGDPSHGFFGHPSCNFCKKRFYDTGHLYEHFTKSHYSCDLCERVGIQHKYYRDYPDLERHFRREHFLCEDPRCLEQRFVVFTNEIDYQGHLLASHPEQGASRKLPLAFRVRGSRRAGEEEEEEGGGSSESMARASSPTPDDTPSEFQMTAEQFPDLSIQTVRGRNRFLPTQGGGGVGRGGGRGSGRPGSGFGGIVPQSGRFSGEDFPLLGGGGSPAGGGGRAGGGAFLHALMPRGARFAQDRDRWSYPEVDIGDAGRGRGKGKKKGGGGGGEGGEGLQQPTPSEAVQQEAQPPPPRNSGQGPLEEIQEFIGEEAFSSLRDVSRELRTGALSGTDYYQQVIRLIPLRPIRLRVMADLLELLSDEELRRDIQGLIDTQDRPASSAASSARPSPPPPPSQRDPTPAELASSSSSQQQAAKQPQQKKKGPASRSSSSSSSSANGWAKAIASASGGAGGPTKMPKGRKPVGLTIVKFKSTSSSGGDGGREGGEGEPASPRRAIDTSDPPLPPPPSGIMMGRSTRAGDMSSDNNGGSRYAIGGYAGRLVEPSPQQAPIRPSAAAGGGGLLSVARRINMNGQEDFPSLPSAPAPAPPPPGLWIGKAVNDQEEEQEAQQGGKGKKKGKKKGPNELQKLAFGGGFR